MQAPCRNDRPACGGAVCRGEQKWPCKRPLAGVGANVPLIVLLAGVSRGTVRTGPLSSRAHRVQGATCCRATRGVREVRRDEGGDDILYVDKSVHRCSAPTPPRRAPRLARAEICSAPLCSTTLQSCRSHTLHTNASDRMAHDRQIRRQWSTDTVLAFYTIHLNQSSIHGLTSERKMEEYTCQVNR